MANDETIRVSTKAYKWLVDRKAKTGVSIKFLVDLAIDALDGKPNELAQTVFKKKGK